MRILRFALPSLAVLCLLTVFYYQRMSDTPESFTTVPPFSLTSQDKQSTSLNTFKGKLWVANFIFTKCPTICPLFTAKMKKLQIELKRRSLDIQLVSFSVDPEYDTPEILKAFGEAHGADFESWTFLTGSFEEIKAVVTTGMKMAMGREGGGEVEVPERVFHGTYFVLVDVTGTIRGYYDFNDESTLSELLEDIEFLYR